MLCHGFRRGQFGYGLVPYAAGNEKKNIRVSVVQRCNHSYALVVYITRCSISEPLKGRSRVICRWCQIRAPRRLNAGKTHCLLLGCRGMAIIHLSTMAKEASKNPFSSKSLKLIILDTNIANIQQASILLCLPTGASSQPSNRPTCLYPFHTIAGSFESSL